MSHSKPTNMFPFVNSGGNFFCENKCNEKIFAEKFCIVEN